MNPTPEQVAKLPRWAQEHLADLTRRTETAERVMNEYLDQQTPSAFYFEDYLCIGEGSPQHVRRYVQTHKIAVERNGIKLEVLLRPNEPGIEISWSAVRFMMSEIPLIPTSFQQMKLIPRDKLR